MRHTTQASHVNTIHISECNNIFCLYFHGHNRGLCCGSGHARDHDCGHGHKENFKTTLYHQSGTIM